MNFSLRTCVLLVAAGSLSVFLGTPNPVIHLPLIILIYPAVICLASRTAAPFRTGWCAGIPGAAAALYWIAVAAHMYGDFPWVLAAPCSILLGMYVALWGGMFSWIMARTLSLSPWRRCALAGVLWFLLEWTRGWFGTGFSWLTLSSGLAAWPVLIQPLSLLGEYAYSGVLAAAACIVCEGIMRLCARGACRGGALMVACAAGLLVSIAAFGAWRLSVMPERLAEKSVPVTVTLVQGSVRQDVKWSKEYQQHTLERYVRLSMDGVRGNVTALAGAEKARPSSADLAAFMGRSALPGDVTVAPALPDFLLWPETAMPFAYPSGPLSAALRDFVRQLGLPLVFGAPGVERQADGKTLLYNRAFLLTPQGDRGHYDKEHLVPFGEYLPPVLDWEIFQSLLQGLGGFEPGTQEMLFPLNLQGRGSLDMGMLICYEAIFPELARKRVAEGAGLLLNISNDAWYDYTSAPMQHLQLALMRAVEEGRYVVRATNSGITAVLDPLGGIHAMGSEENEHALFVPGSLTGTALALQGHTPYFYLHPWLPAAGLILLLLLGLPLVRRGRA
ncbi:apolipoprotein N-acyltransferase [uncultured Mailhella sp.]|uniref:apolipoprotein N-acyltransferase n=1 Tax=uncultured Mailhella sp. TaxID=1981031 RepID=UPI0025CC31CB|nr:apolipoprotein N-acyltransferase [uncultured Mailhella sp.]